MKNFRLTTIRTPLVYAIFGLSWILLTDFLLLWLVSDVEVMAQWQIYKGWLFVGLSTLIIYALVNQSARQNEANQAALAYSEKMYRLLFNNNPLPMWVYDLETLQFLEVNEAAVNQYQYSRAKFLTLTIKDIRPVEDIPLLLQDVSQTIRSLNFAGEWRHCRQDGTVFPVEIISHTLDYNGRSARLVVAKDLTDQKRIEAEKASISQRNQALVQALGEIVYEWSPPKNLVSWEGDSRRILGYTITEMGTATADWQEKIHPDDQAFVDFELNNAFKHKENLAIEYRFLQRDGTYRWMLDRGVPVYDSQGNLEKMIGVFLDIHNRKLIENALRESENRLRKAIEFAPFPIMIHAEDGEVLAISQTWTEITGYTPEEISTVAEWISNAYETDQEPAILAGIDQLYELDKRIDEGEFIVNCKNGEKRIWQFSSAPLGHLYDGRRSVISIAADMTERKKTENQLHLQSSALNAAANGIVITDIDGLIQWANPAFTTLTGYTLEEALGKNPRELVKSGRHDREFYEAMWNTILAGKVWRGELINRRKDGQLYYEEEAITPVWNEAGQMTHFIAIKQDITNRKQAENEQERLLKQVQAQAEQMNQIMQSVPEGILLLGPTGQILVANAQAREYLQLLPNTAVGNMLTELDSDILDALFEQDSGKWHEIVIQEHIFELTARQINFGIASQGWVLVLRDVTKQKQIEEQLQRQERLAAVGQLAAGIAHDFNNLLAVILLYTQLLARSPRLVPNEQAKLATIDQQAKRAARLIEQVLDFSRRAVFEKRPLDLLVLFKEEIKLLKRTLPENIDITLESQEEGHFVVDAEVTRIQQTIMNLAFNARDAMPDGGSLTFRLGHASVSNPEQAPLPMMPPGSWVHLSVHDSGTGIDPAVLNHIFEPFVTTKEPGKGTGLGLSQVHGIVAQHDGFIGVQSQPGAGTTFNIYLPLLHLLENEPGHILPETAVSGRGERLLVVEDEADLRSALVESLHLLQYDVLETANGLEALTVLAQGTAVDLIICDVIMPQMGGLAFVQALQQRPSPPPVIFITGHPLGIDANDLRKMGVRGVLPKPIQTAQLSQAIAAALQS